MRRRFVIPLLSCAALTLCHGCADSPPSVSTIPQLESPNSSDRSVVVATHFESAPSLNSYLDEAPLARPSVVPNASPRFRRLPPVYSIPVPVQPIPKTPAPNFQRLPALDRVAVPAMRPHAIDLTENVETQQSQTASPAPTVSLMPSIVKIVTEKEETKGPVVPRKRFERSTAPKPPLTPLSNQSAAAPSGSKGWLATGTSLAAVSQRADATINRGFQLAEKGAFYSARTEFKQALRIVSQALDAHFGGTRRSGALAAGWLALEEAGDFSVHSQRGPVVNVSLVVNSHQTSLLKDYDLHDVSPVVAMQHYFAFAQEQLIEACGHAPVASRALHGLGKVHMVLAEKSASAERLHGPKSLAFQQAALATDPSNYLAANELGVLLARFGKLQEARTVLQYSVASYPLPETWQNLSIVHQRLGETNLAAQSMANWRRALQQSGQLQPSSQSADSRSTVQWVAPEAFSQSHPLPTAAPSHLPTQQVATQQRTPPRVANQRMTVPQPVQSSEKKKSGFLWW